jgi:hypothetical protein
MSEAVATLLRAIDLNDHFQLLAIIYDDPSISLPRDLASAAVPPMVARLMNSSCPAVDVRWVGTGEEAIARVLSPNLSLTIFDSRGRTPLAVELFFSSINSNRDVMAKTPAPSSLLVVVPRELLPAISRTAQDIWSCVSVTISMPET